MKIKSFGRWFAIIGASLQVFVLIAILGIIFGIFRAQEVVGFGEEQMLLRVKWIDFSESISAISSVFVYIGIVMIIISMFAFKYKAKWFTVFAAIYGVYLLLSFPLGTILGVVFLIYFFKEKSVSHDF